MTTQTMYHTLLALHLAGLTLLAGTTVADFAIFRQFWKQWTLDKSKARGIQDSLLRLPALIGAGAVLLILSGVGMMALSSGVFGEQVWFRIKFVFVILIILNGLLYGRRQGLALKKTLTREADGQPVEEQLSGIRQSLRTFHMIQLVFFAIILILSVFKFV